MGIRLNSRKLNAALKQCWDEGYRLGINGYRPTIYYKNDKAKNEFIQGYTTGLNEIGYSIYE